MPVNPSLHNIQHDTDPAKALLEKIGDVSVRKISGKQVLVATYIRPEKTTSGLLLTEKSRQEDEYQGKVGLIINMGPLAFEGMEAAWPDDTVPKIGDFVVYRALDGFMTQFNGHPCRTLEDKQIREIVPNPDIVL